MSHPIKMPAGRKDWWISMGLLVLCILAFGAWAQFGSSFEGFQVSRAGTVVPFSQSFINCVARTVGSKGVKQWLCETEEDAGRILKGPTDPAQAYIGPSDFVCIKMPDTTPVQYFCKDLDLPVDAEDPRYDMMDTITQACDNLNKTYVDLSNNVTNLINMRNTVDFTASSLGKFRTELTDLKTVLKCSTYQSSTDSNKAVYKAVCDKVDAAISSIGTDRETVNTLLGKILDPVTNALALRDTSKTNLDQFQCQE